jgi:hypothetical protein
MIIGMIFLDDQILKSYSLKMDKKYEKKYEEKKKVDLFYKMNHHKNVL